MKRIYKLSLCIFFGFFIFSFPAFANLQFLDSLEPPPGFLSMHMKQYSRVSVQFMHQHIGFFYIDIDQGKLTFNEPKKILSQLEGAKQSKNLLHLLSQSFSLNIECHKNSTAMLPDYCDKLSKKSIYVIYDPAHDTVYLHLAPSYFKKPIIDGAIDFIPSSSTGWSYINKLGATGSFSNEETDLSSAFASSTSSYYNIYSNNILSHGNNSVIGNLTQNNGVENEQNFQIQNFYAQHIARDKIYSSGYIANAVSPFFQTQTILGAGIRTTLDTIKNMDSITSTPLVIFVPQAAQVSIFKNEQLIYSQYLEAGYQRINTRGFPEGGYQLTIKIGANNIIRQFFTKGLFLPPANAPQFYLLGGYLTNGMLIDNNTYHLLPNVLNIPVLQTGINKRLNDRIAILGDVLLNSHQGLIDFGPTFILGDSLIKIAGLATTKNNYGLYTMLSTQQNNVNISFIGTKIFYQKKHANYFFLNNLVDNDSVSVSYKLSDYDLLGIQANYNKSLEQTSTYNAGTFYQHQVGNYKGMNFFFNAAYNKATDSGNTFNLSVSVNFSHDKITGSESLLWQHQTNNSNNNQAATPIAVQGSTIYSNQNEQGIGHTVNEIHTISNTVMSLAGTYNYTGQNSFVSTYINDNKIKNEKHFIGYGGNFETEFAINQNGSAFNGVDRSNLSGMIAYVDTGDTKDTTSRFAVLDANNRKIAVLPANKKVFISIPSFTDQPYSLVNLSNTDYYINEPMRRITLYPGNISFHQWTAEKRLIVIGRVIKQDRMPLANTWIHVANNGIYSDDEGNFQLELPVTVKVLDTETSCRLKLPKLNINKTYIYIGDIMCS